jgi:hypothetical protein
VGSLPSTRTTKTGSVDHDSLTLSRLCLSQNRNFLTQSHRRLKQQIKINNYIMTGKEQSPLDDNYSYEPPTVVAESIRSNLENEPTSLPSVSKSTTRVESVDSVEGPRIDIAKDVPADQKHLVKPAGIGGAILGFLLGGPIGCAFLGFGAAYAVRKENCTGDAARALGEMTFSVQQKAAEIEDRHRYYERSVSAINNQCQKSEKSAAYKTREFVVSSWKSVENYTHRHQLIERGVEGTGKGVEFIASTITGNKKKMVDDEAEVLLNQVGSKSSFKDSIVAKE